MPKGLTDGSLSICTGSIALKSSNLKVMGGMLGTRCRETLLLDQTCCMCLFCTKAITLPPGKPLAMVLMTNFGLSRGLSFFSLE